MRLVLVFLLGLIANGLHAQSNLTPFYNFEEPRPKKPKPQQPVMPRFPPQFRTRDTIGGKQSPAYAKPETSTAQTAGTTAPKASAPKPPKPKIDTVYKVISRKIDASGNEIKEVEAVAGKVKWKETYITPNGNQLNRPFNIDTLNLDSITVQVVKKNYRLYVYHKHKFLTSYKVVFGANHMVQKVKEGDKATPEGYFKITERHAHKDWTLFMGIDYPNEESRKIWEENKRKGLVGPNDRIGGAIGIHGVWNGADMVVDQKRNWTDGCIAMKQQDLLELSRLLKTGTIIHIRRSADSDFQGKIQR